MPPNAVSGSWIPNARRTQFRFDLDPGICGRRRLDFLFLSELARSDRVNEARRVSTSVVNPTKFARAELFRNMLEGCGSLSLKRFRTLARLIRQSCNDFAIVVAIFGA
jgi:hypothetical protein